MVTKVSTLIVPLVLLSAVASPAAEPVRFPARALDRIARSFEGRIGFYVKDLRGGTTYGWNATRRLPPASAIKLPVMIELFRQAADGTFKLDDKRLLPADISTHGSGRLKQRSGAVELTLREYCRLMIVSSDNMATDMLIRTVTPKRVNRFLARQKLGNTRLAYEIGRWHYVIVGMHDEVISRANDAIQMQRVRSGRFDDDGLGYSNSRKNNVCGPRDMVRLLERLYAGELAGPEATREMLELMAESTHKQTIARHLKPGIRVMNKYGGSRRIAADVGIVELPGRPLVIAAFALADDGKTRNGRDILATMSRLAIEAIDPSAVNPPGGR